MQNSSIDSETVEDRIKKALHEITIDKALVQSLIFFVGAGVSHDPPSNLALFGELNKEIIRSATSSMLNEDDYEILSYHIRPEILLQILTDTLPRELVDELLRLLKEIMSKAEPNSNHFLLAQVLRQDGWVFTTNYDNLIEEASKTVDVKRCYNDSKFEEFYKRYISTNTRNLPGGYVFKLHGTIEDPESILATLRSIGKGLTNYKEKVLEYFLQNFNFCFMGYSCQDDFDILHVLLNTSSNKSVVWFQYRKGEIGQIICGRNILEYEREKEQKRPLGEKKEWSIINANEFLLKKKVFLKIVGDSSRFVRHIFPSSIRRESTENMASIENGRMVNQFSEWARKISDYDKNLIAGRLFNYIESFDKAEEYLKKSENFAQEKTEKAIAQRGLADTYYRKEKDEAYREANKVLIQKTLPIYEEAGDVFGIVQVDIDIANNLRRLKDYSEALKYAEKAKKLLEDNRDELKEKKKEYYDLEHGRCLNIMGLIHYGMGDSSKSLQEIQTGLEFCEKSREIREKIGDVSMVAESENAMGLILRVNADHLKQFDKEKAIQLLRESLKYLKGALDKKERACDNRGCQQCYRNLALAHDLLGELIPEEKEKHFLEAARFYEEEANYIRKMPNPPIDRFLEIQFRIGQQYRKLGRYENVIGILEKVVKERDEMRDWHNKARTLNELREAYERTSQKERCIDSCREIKSIYKSVLEDRNRLEEMKKKGIMFRNAVEEILPNTENSLRRLGLTPEAEEVAYIIERLKKEIMTGNI
jgi:tetratricopeptide (TPR) repeat protein